MDKGSPMEDILLINCPKCSNRILVPKDYIGTARCPKCKFEFEKSSSTEPEVLEDEENFEICTHCGGENKIEMDLEGLYRCKFCDYDVPTSRQSAKVRKEQERRMNHWSAKNLSGILKLIGFIIMCLFIICFPERSRRGSQYCAGLGGKHSQSPRNVPIVNPPAAHNTSVAAKDELGRLPLFSQHGCTRGGFGWAAELS